MTDAITRTDAARRALGFLTVEETAALADQGITIPDPASTLVSPGVVLGQGAILWPGTILQSLAEGHIAVGPGAILFPGTRIVAAGGRVTVGAGAEIGEEGGFTIKAEGGASIGIGSGARLLGGGSLTRSNSIGDGAQILGPIRCQNCRLGAGGSHREPDPDLRGGVLKGSGIARNIEVPQGHVIQSFAVFAESPLRKQTFFHPKTPL